MRLEIEAALARNIRVVPVLVGGARMPRADELPASLAKLARRQALELSPNQFDFDLRRLLKVLDIPVPPSQLARTLTHTSWVAGVAFSPDGRLLATASNDATARVWDPATGNCLRTLTGHTHVVYDVAFSPEAALLATGSGDQTARVWDPATGNCLRTLTGHTGRVYDVAFSPDGRQLATASYDQTARLWN